MPDATPATSTSAPRGASRSFVPRLVSTLVLWGLIFTALAFRLDWPLFVLAAVFGLLGTWEYGGLQRADAAARPFTRMMLFFSAAYWIATGWQGLRSRGGVIPGGGEAIPLWIDAVFLMLMVGGAFGLVLARPLDGENTQRRVLNSVFGFIYTTLAFGYIVRLLFFPGTEFGAHVMLLVIATVKFGDMGAYLVGSWLGRHKMVPHISPAKSWEGAGGAVLGSLVAGVAMMLAEADHLRPLTWPHLFGFSLLLCMAGMLGDLAESVLKRCHAVKDSGRTFPGIGGILDLTDSLIFAAPVAYFYLRAIA